MLAIIRRQEEVCGGTAYSSHSARMINEALREMTQE